MSFEKYSFLLTKTFLFFCLSQFPVIVIGQNETPFFQIGASESESVEFLTTNTAEQVLVAGLFNSSFNWDGLTLETVGENDIFIAQLDEATPQWIRSFGSTGQDELLALTTDAADNILLSISYLNAIQLADTLLVPSTGLRGLALLKFNSLGELLWAKDWSSTGIQVLHGLVTDSQNQIYACGSFSGTLAIDGQQLEAQSEEDLFLANLSPEGNLVNWEQAGIAGKTRPQALALNTAETSISISGVFNGKTSFGVDTIQANTNDFDVFVAQFNTDSTPRWGRKAGGVFEDGNSAILIDEKEDIFVVGDFQGVLRLNDTIEITTNGIQDNNIYILQYSSDGTPQWGRSLGGTNFDFVTDATWSNAEQIAIAGYFQNSISIDELTAQTDGFAGYIVGLSSETGQAEWLEAIPSEDLIIPNHLTVSHEQLVVGGAFSNSISYKNTLLQSNGFFDGFLLYFDESLTPTTNISFAPSSSIYPNPCSDYFSIQTSFEHYSIRLVDAYGQVLIQGDNLTRIAVEDLANGIYFLEIMATDGSREMISVVVQ